MYSNMQTYKQREKYTYIQTQRETHTHQEETYTDTFEVNWDFRVLENQTFLRKISL